jgi:hypothetical protein
MYEVTAVWSLFESFEDVDEGGNSDDRLAVTVDICPSEWVVKDITKAACT